MSHSSTEAPTTPISSFVPDLDRLAAEVMADWKVPGVALAVVQDGKLALTRAYGQRDVEAGLPVSPATQFVICSITKSFTATAIALLHHEGRLDWTKPVRDYMAEFRLSDAVATERVTVRDLLCHQSGLPRHDWVHFAGDRAPSEMLGVMRHLELSRDIRRRDVFKRLGRPGMRRDRLGQGTAQRQRGDNSNRKCSEHIPTPLWCTERLHSSSRSSS